MTTTVRQMTVHEATWDLLSRFGVEKVFGNPGSTEMTFLNGLPDEIEFVLGLQEAAVVAMADAYAQSTGRPALVNLHTAAGLGNGMGAIVNAKAAQSPLVITAGQQVRAMLTLEPFLANPEATLLPQPAVKWAYEPPSADAVPAAFARAFALAALPPAGPVFLSLPMDDWSAAVVDPRTVAELAARHVDGRTMPSADSLAHLAQRLGRAERPALVIGAGADASPGAFDRLPALARRLAAPVYLAPNAARVGFPTDDPNFRGSLPAAIPWVAEALSGHDLVLVIGAPVFQYYPYAAGEYLPDGVELVMVVDDPAVAARAPVGDALIGDPGLTVSGLLELVDASARPALQAPNEEPVAIGESRLTAGQVHEVLGRVLPAAGIVVSETMNGGATMWERVKFRRPGSFFFCAGGGLGFGIPGGVGAQLAQPDRPVVSITGDGGAQYGIQALYTASRYSVPLTILVFENGEYGILKGFGEFLGADQVPGLDIDGLDYQALARGYGIESVRAHTAVELESALTDAINDRSQPHLIVAAIAAGVRLGG
jgi:benzoylformate decarboxylase